MYLQERVKAKLHNGFVTGANLNYEGSVTIGKNLLKESTIKPFDKVQVLNITNGNRIETYVIEGEDNEICLNGAAAHLFDVGDRVIIIDYLLELKDSYFIGKWNNIAGDLSFSPNVVIVILNEKNEIVSKKEIPLND